MNKGQIADVFTAAHTKTHQNLKTFVPLGRHLPPRPGGTAAPISLCGLQCISSVLWINLLLVCGSSSQHIERKFHWNLQK